MEPASILVCEDEALIAKDIQRTLEKKGYNVVGIASNARKALELAEEWKPDLALMDIHLKGSVDGTQVAETLNDQYDIPSIFLTAFHDEDTVDSAKVARPLGYLLKPFEKNELFTTIETGLSRYREQRKLFLDIQENLESYCKSTMDKVELERQKDSLDTEKNSCNRQILKRVSQTIGRDVDIVREQIENICALPDLPQPCSTFARVALVHQDFIAQFIEDLHNMADDKNPNFVCHNLGQIIVDAMREYENEASCNLSFLESLYPQPLFANVDKHSLKEALYHIFSNACDASDANAVIHVGTTLSYEESPERFNPIARAGWYIQMKISDYGKGIAEDKLEKIREPLYSRNEQGFHFGLGIPTIENIVQKHRGWLSIESKEEQETHVSIFLPETKVYSSMKH